MPVIEGFAVEAVEVDDPGMEVSSDDVVGDIGSVRMLARDVSEKTKSAMDMETNPGIALRIHY